MKYYQCIYGLFFFLLVSITAQWKSLDNSESKQVVVNLLEEGENGTIIKFHVPGYYYNTLDIEKQSYSKLSMPEVPLILEKGYPELPRFNQSIIISDKAKMNFEIVEAEYDTIECLSIAPSKGSISRSVDPETVPYVFSEYYETDTWWPLNTIELSEPFILRDVRGITVRFNMFRYNPVKGQLIVCKQLIVRVYEDGEDVINVKENNEEKTDADFSNIYKNIFLNFSSLSKSNLDEVTYSSVGESGRMLIIAADDFYDSVIPLRDWRTRTGHKTTLVKCSDVGTTSSEVASYIQTMYNSTESVAYILLVGEGNNDIPNKSVPTLGSTAAPKDPLYTLLDGSDSYPDAYISRISANTVSEVTNQVNRIIKYEKNPSSGGWTKQATGIASSQSNGGLSDEERADLLRADLLQYGYTAVDMLYDITSSSYISTAINSGRGLVNFIGHGTETEWGFNDPYVWPLFSVSNVQSLSNTNQLPFVFSVACQVGSFTEETTCFAEAWLRSGTSSSPTGAIGFYGSSIDQPWVEPCIAQAEAVDLLVGDSKLTIGGLAFNGSCKMIEDYPSSGPGVFNTWHIFGDAATSLWTDTPESFDNVQITDNTSNIVVTSGVSGSNIIACSIDNGESYFDKYENVSTATFSTSVRPLYITVTKHNYIPYRALSGGTLSSSLTISEDLIIAGDLTVSGATLTVDSGTELKFTDGSSIIVNGKLYAGGTSSSPIVFTSAEESPSKGDWDGIRFLNSSSMSLLSYCEVSYAANGIYLDNSNIILSYNYIHHSQTGNLRAANGADSYMLWYNTLSNGSYGVYASSDVSLNFSLNYGVSGNSIHTNNVNLYCTDNSYILLGSTQYSFYNSSYNSSSPYSAFVTAISELKAENVWWGTADEDDLSFVTAGNSTVDYSPCLTSNPNMGSPLESSVGSSGSKSITLSPISSISSSSLSIDVNDPESLYEAGDYYHGVSNDKAIEYWQTIIESFPESDYAVNALVRLYSLDVDSAETKLESYLDELSGAEISSANTNLAKLQEKAMILKTYKALREGDLTTASQLANDMTAGYPGSQAELYGLYTLSMHEEMSNSDAAFKQLKESYPDEDLTLFAREIKGEKVDWSLSESDSLEQEDAEEEGIEQEYVLSLADNYPNPFNPTTTITFTLPESDNAQLIVYDILGREVMKLADGFHEAGEHRFQFNASDLASGVYIYRLKTSSKVFTKKMMLLK